MLKRIAEKILSDEIRRLKEDKEYYEKRNIELRGEMQELEIKLSDKQTEINSINSEKALAEKRTKEVEKENEILRQYYDLDKEPSDEIKTKIHIDLEINKLKEENQRLRDENLKLITMYRPPVYIPQPYQYYGLGYRRVLKAR